MTKRVKAKQISRLLAAVSAMAVFGTFVVAPYAQATVVPATPTSTTNQIGASTPGGTVTNNSTTVNGHGVSTTNTQSVTSSTNLTTTPNTVTLIDFTNLSGGALNLQNLTNNGTIYGYVHTGGPTTGTINANTITNNGTISTMLPTSVISFYHLSNILTSFSLTLNAITAITNNGLIASSGALAMSAPSIVNSANATIMATQAVTMQASTIQNLGSIMAGVQAATMASALNANVNANLVNVQGVLASIQNNISNLTSGVVFRDMGNGLTFTGGTNDKSLVTGSDISFVTSALQQLTVTNGNFVANHISFNAGNPSDLTSGGWLNVNANKITGNVDAFGGWGNVGVNKGDLNINSLTFNGSVDPTVYDKSGSIVLNIPGISISAPQDFSVFASKNIGVTAGSSGATLTAGSINMQAGANVVVADWGGVWTDGASATGGNVNLSGVNLITNGGGVNLAANAGSAHNGIVTVGNITTTSLIGDAGSVTVNAAGNIKTGDITANGASVASASFIPFMPMLLICEECGKGGGSVAGRGGDISLYSQNGGITSGALTSVGGNGLANGIGGGDGGNISVNADKNISLGQVQTVGGNGAAGASIFFFGSSSGGNGGNGGNIDIASTNGNVLLNGCVGTAGGSGGQGADGAGFIFGSDGASGGNGGNGGSITISAGKNVVALDKIQSFGGSGGNGGTGAAAANFLFFNSETGSGGAGGNGGSTGNISLAAKGNVTLKDTVETLGGAGGNGGTGGSDSSDGGWGGFGGDAGRGGTAGDITIRANGDITTSRVLSFGGDGGNGGVGGSGTYAGSGGSGAAAAVSSDCAGCSSIPYLYYFGGSAGISGGNSGAIKISSKNGNVILTDTVETTGGHGGNGGNAGSGQGGETGSGGDAGKGGFAGNIDISGVNVATQKVLSFGGDSGNGGTGSAGGSGGSARTPNDVSWAGWNYGYTWGEDTSHNWDAGKGGNITITASNSIIANDTIQTAGGNGGNGGASQSIAGFDVSSGSGGAGGNGGKAGNISLTVTGSDMGGGLLSTKGIMSFGGNGGNGGNGGALIASVDSDSSYVGLGGDGGNGGKSGSITLNAPPLSLVSINGTVETVGGNGGNGGNAGTYAGSPDGSVWGGAAGKGGNGGNAGSINVSSGLGDIGDLSGSPFKLLDKAGPFLFYVLGSLGDSDPSALFSSTSMTTKNIMSFGGNGGNAGTVTSTLDAYNGAAGGKGGNSGNISVGSIFGGLSSGTLQTVGGNGGNGSGIVSGANGWGETGGQGGRGGNAGAITVANLVGNVAIDQMLSFGGNGGNGAAGFNGGDGGKGGRGGNTGDAEMISFLGPISVGSIQLSGGNGGSGGAGGVGFDGESLGSGAAGGNGGSAGSVLGLNFLGGFKFGNVLLFGGNGGNGGAGGINDFTGAGGGRGGKGGNTGDVNIESGLGSVQFATIQAVAGNGGNGGDGAGKGSASAGGAGGSTGNVSITVSNGDITGKDILLFGGNGGNGGNGASAFIGQDGGHGGSGGSAGSVMLEASGSGEDSGIPFFDLSSGSGNVALNNVQIAGGAGGNGGNGGNSGSPFNAGNGGKGGNGGNSGNSDVGIYISGNSISFSHLLSYGNKGGNGGNAPLSDGSEAESVGGQGGNGGRGGSSGPISYSTFPVLFFLGGSPDGVITDSGSVVFGGVSSGPSTPPVQTFFGLGGAGGAGGSGDFSGANGHSGKPGTAGSINGEFNFFAQPCCSGMQAPIAGVTQVGQVPRVALVPADTLFCCHPVAGGGTPTNPTTPTLVQTGPNTVSTNLPGSSDNTSTSTFNSPTGLFGFLPPTDTTRGRTVPPLNPVFTDVIEIGNNGTTGWTIISTNKLQPYEFEGDDGTIVLASAGTEFTVTGDHQIKVIHGSVLVIAGGANVNVSTEYGTITIPKGAATDIAQSRFGGVNVADLSGPAASFAIAFNGKSNNVEIPSASSLQLSADEIATAGGSDFVPNLEQMSGPVQGLISQTQQLNSAVGSYLEQLLGVESGALSPNGAHSLAEVIKALSGIAGANGSPNIPADVGYGIVDKNLMPVAHAVPVPAVTPVAPPTVQPLQTLKLDSGSIKHVGKAILFKDGSGVLSLKGGEILVDASKPMEVGVGDTAVYLGKNTLALLERVDGVTTVRNICETQGQSIEVVSGNRRVKLFAGQEIDISPSESNITSLMKNDKIARRRVESAQVGGANKATIAEFSLVSLCGNNTLMAKVMRDEAKSSKVIADRILKMAACLMQVTRSRGAYQKVASK